MKKADLPTSSSRGTLPPLLNDGLHAHLASTESIFSSLVKALQDMAQQMATQDERVRDVDKKLETLAHNLQGGPEGSG